MTFGAKAWIAPIGSPLEPHLIHIPARRDLALSSGHTRIERVCRVSSTSAYRSDMVATREGFALCRPHNVAVGLEDITHAARGLRYSSHMFGSSGQVTYRCQ